MQNAPIVYVAPKHQSALMHSLKRVWVGLMLLRGAKRARKITSEPAAEELDPAA